MKAASTRGGFHVYGGRQVAIRGVTKRRYVFIMGGLYL